MLMEHEKGRLSISVHIAFKANDIRHFCITTTATLFNVLMKEYLN